MVANLVTAFLAAAFMVLPEQAQAAAAIDGGGMSLL